MYTINISGLSKDEYIYLNKIIIDFVNLKTLESLCLIKDETYKDEFTYNITRKISKAVFNNYKYNEKDKEEIYNKINEQEKYSNKCFEELCKNIGKLEELHKMIEEDEKIRINRVKEYLKKH